RRPWARPLRALEMAYGPRPCLPPPRPEFATDRLKASRGYRHNLGHRNSSAHKFELTSETQAKACSKRLGPRCRGQTGRAAEARPAALPKADRHAAVGGPPRCRGRTAALPRADRPRRRGRTAALPTADRPRCRRRTGHAADGGPATLPRADLPTAALAVITGGHAAGWRHGSRRKDPRLQRAQAGAAAASADNRARRRAR